MTVACGDTLFVQDAEVKQAEKAVQEAEQQLKRLRDQIQKLKKVKDAMSEAVGSEEQDELEELRRQIKGVNDEVKELEVDYAKVSPAASVCWSVRNIVGPLTPMRMYGVVRGFCLYRRACRWTVSASPSGRRGTSGASRWRRNLTYVRMIFQCVCVWSWHSVAARK